MKIKYQLKKFNFNIYKLKNNIYNLLNQKKYKRKIAIVSCDKWIYKVKEDWYLKHYLNKIKVDVDIISWQDKTIEYNKYDAIVVKSIWGFKNFELEFRKWLDYIEQNHINIINNINIIKNNYDKEKQFKILEKNNFKIIPTRFVQNCDDVIDKVQSVKKKYFNNYDSIIVKPTISESGNDTYIVGENNLVNKNIIEFSELKEKYKLLKNKNLMIQPFIESVFEGEYSICYIDGKLTHAILRNSGVFDGKNIIKYIPIEQLDKDIIELTNNIVKIPEYAESVYVRIDIIKHQKEYLIMEVEMLDPNLFIEFIIDKANKTKTLKEFASGIVEKCYK